VPMLRPALRRLRDDETGDSPVTSIAGVVIFLGFLLLAAQTAIHLYAVSTSTSVLFDEARRVAAAVSTGTYDCGQAEDAVRDRLGRWGHEVAVTCRGDDGTADHVRVRLVGPSPANLVAAFGDATGLATFERTVQVRTERFR
jgi:hypothetical protein